MRCTRVEDGLEIGISPDYFGLQDMAGLHQRHLVNLVNLVAHLPVNQSD